MNPPTATTASSAPPAGVVTPEDPPQEFLNRELSWLQFYRRVLHEALDDRTPLLERVLYLSICNMILDEFFQKRVGGLKRQISAGIVARTADGMTPRQQLAAIRESVLPMLKVQADCFKDSIKPALAEEDIELLTWDELTKAERRQACEYFHEILFPVLTPLAVDPRHPFPFISNLSMSLGIILRYPTEASGELASRGPAQVPGEPGAGEPSAERRAIQFARIKVPQILPRWVRLNAEGNGSYRFVHIEQIIRNNLASLFEGMVIEEVMLFRITRNADVERDEEDAEDLLELVEQEVRDRRLADAIRLEVPQDPDLTIMRRVMGELGLEDSDVYPMAGELDYTDLRIIHALNLPRLKYEPWSPVVPGGLGGLGDEQTDIFSTIRAGDVLVHHPFDSFGASVERFIRAAVADPKVVAIKLTLYRTSEDSPFIPDLIRAAEAGKQVVCLVELKARFDEERNIQVARQLEKAGVHVVYGVVNLKTHTKTAMVVRHEADGMRVYAHIGSGNYNSDTAQSYTDLGLFTCDIRLTSELVELFHYLTGCSLKSDFKHLLVAPINMKQRFKDMIDRELAHVEAWQKRGGDPDDPNRPLILAKMNSLEDRGICRKLYRASQGGVKIKLIVRGFCCLRPGVPGLSENISVLSVIGRFLEHSRIFCFHNNAKPEYYLGSADWMHRNLNDRVECITPIEDPALQRKLRQILDVLLSDQRQAWDMQPDGTYIQRRPNPTIEGSDQGSQQVLMDMAHREVRLAEERCDSA